MSDVPPIIRKIGKYERLWRERHERDLDLTRRPGGHPKGYRYDAETGERVVHFVEAYCCHHEGKWAGKPLKLEEWQKDLIRHVFGWLNADGTRRFRKAYIEVGRKNGKSLLIGALTLYMLIADGEQGAQVYSSAPLDLATPVPTPTGWSTMGALVPGDLVFDENGCPTRVVAVSEVFEGRPALEVRFHDGERIVTDEEHIWSVRSTATGSLRGRPKSAWRETAVRRGDVIRSTRQLRETLVGPNGASNHSVRLAGSVQLPEADLPIPPYTLGAWLGDGRQNRGAIVFHENDRSILEHIEAEGFETRRHDVNSVPHLLKFTVLGLRTRLRRAGLLDLKHVPAAYLRASAAQRLELIRGLMDTDGTCTKTGECRFTNRSEPLARAVHELLTSVGVLAHLRSVLVTGRPHYVVSFRTAQRVFHLERKAARQRPPGPRARQRYITAVTPVASRPVRCIEVESPSHLFLVGRSMVPTHNTKKDQARIVWKNAAEMVKRSAELKRFVKVFRNSMTCERMGSKFEPLSSEDKMADGLNPHCNAIDELHAHQTRKMWDVLDSALGAREQPLTLVITTAGDYDPESIGWEVHDYATKVLEGVVESDEFFALICSAYEGEETEAILKENPEYYFSVEAQLKANPNYGVSCKPSWLAGQAKQAQDMPGSLTEYLTKNCNVWVRGEKKWLSLEKWAKCEPALPVGVTSRAYALQREQALLTKPCFGGLDLASKLDLTALVLAFPLPGEVYELICRFWLPQRAVHEAAKKGQHHYEQWAAEGWLSVTPGDAIDNDFIKAEVKALAARYNVQQLAYDKFGAQEISTHLTNEGLTMVECGQGFISMSEPAKKFEASIVTGRIRHSHNPVMRFCVANAVTRTDPAGNIKPDKAQAGGKIDGVVAAVMAMSRIVVAKPPPAGSYLLHSDLVVLG